MRRCQDLILIICRHPGSLIEYSRIFNQIGCFGLILCSSEAEALLRVSSGAKFSYLVYDDFSFDADSCIALEELCRAGRNIILLSEATESQHSAMLHWVRARQVDIRVLPRPISTNHLRVIFNSYG